MIKLITQAIAEQPVYNRFLGRDEMTYQRCMICKECTTVIYATSATKAPTFNAHKPTCTVSLLPQSWLTNIT